MRHTFSKRRLSSSLLGAVLLAACGLLLAGCAAGKDSASREQNQKSPVRLYVSAVQNSTKNAPRGLPEMVGSALRTTMASRFELYEKESEEMSKDKENRLVLKTVITNYDPNYTTFDTKASATNVPIGKNEHIKDATIGAKVSTEHVELALMIEDSTTGRIVCSAKVVGNATTTEGAVGGNVVAKLFKHIPLPIQFGGKTSTSLSTVLEQELDKAATQLMAQVPARYESTHPLVSRN